MFGDRSCITVLPVREDVVTLFCVFSASHVPVVAAPSRPPEAASAGSSAEAARNASDQVQTGMARHMSQLRISQYILVFL